MLALKNFFRKYNTSARTFKLIKGKNDPPQFFPLNANIGGKPKLQQIQVRNSLTDDQARHIYKKVQLGSIIHINTLKEEINPYRELIVSNA